MKRAPAEDRNLADARVNLRTVRVLCVGNGGMIRRSGKFYTHRSMVDFMAELGGMVEELCFCAWLDPDDDPLAQSSVNDAPGVRSLALPRFAGSFLRRATNGVLAFSITTREVFRAHFVYLYWPGRLSSVTARICRLVGTPYAIYFRGEQIPPDPSFAIAFKQARFVLSTGQALNDLAAEHCRDVENVTPMTLLRPPHIVSPRAARPPGPWKLLYVGRVEERKGIRDLLAALVYLEDWGIEYSVTLVGHTYEVESLFGAASPAIREKVRLARPVADFEELRKYYLAADVFVLPSHDEGFPRVLYEAMAFGLPIITTFVGSIPSLMKDGENCLRIEVKAPEDIAEKTRYLLTNPEIYTRLSGAGHRHITGLVHAWQRTHAVQIAERLRGYLASGTL